jgi:hypothetical protein
MPYESLTRMTLPPGIPVAQTPAERFAQEEQQRAERRQREIAEQRSDTNSPDVRIHAWERLHGLRMPSDPAHPVLNVIAASTRLTPAQIREEQAARAARAQPKQPL